MNKRSRQGLRQFTDSDTTINIDAGIRHNL